MDDRQRTFVVGIDASNVADRALRWAREAAGPDDRIVAVHAWTVPSIIMADDDTAIPVTELESFAQRGVADFVRELGDPRVEGVAVEGHAGRAIVGRASEVGADLIAVGHEGSGRASLVLGSTANYVAQGADRPVVIVRGERVVAPRRVVVGIDDPASGGDEGDNVSFRALEWAASLPGLVALDIVHATDDGGDDHGLGAVADFAERAARAAGRPAVDLAITTHAEPGSPASLLIEASETADLVVVGTRGRGGFVGLLLGSTSQALASHSHSCVAIVR